MLVHILSNAHGLAEKGTKMVIWANSMHIFRCCLKFFTFSCASQEHFCVCILDHSKCKFQVPNFPVVLTIWAKKVALIIFTLIAVYYFFIAKEPSAKSFTPNIKSKHHRFFHGMLLSLLNVFPVPFQAYMVTTLATYGLLSFEKYEIITYISGVTMGSFVMLYIYMFFFEKGLEWCQ